MFVRVVLGLLLAVVHKRSFALEGVCSSQVVSTHVGRNPMISAPSGERPTEAATRQQRRQSIHALFAVAHSQTGLEV